MPGCPQCMMSRRSIVRSAVAALAGSVLASGPAPALAVAGKVAGRTDALPIDFHTHMFDPDLPNLITGAMTSTHVDAWLHAMKSPKVHVDHMDRYGVGSHVVGYSNATHGISWGDPDHDLRLYRATNDRIAREWISAFPGRFHGAFSLPMQDISLAMKELERCTATLGMRVLQLSSCSPDGIYFGDRRFDPMWEAVHRLGLTVFIHPHGQDNRPPFDDFALSNSVGQGVEEIKVMTSIIYNGVFDRFPGIKIVIAHGGGFLPHYYGRLDRNALERPQTMRNISRMPSTYLRDFYYDSCVYSPDILTALIKIVGIDRIVLGSDYPVGEEDGLGDLRKTPGLTPDMVEQIAVRTPGALLKA